MPQSEKLRNVYLREFAPILGAERERAIQAAGGNQESVQRLLQRYIDETEMTAQLEGATGFGPREYSMPFLVEQFYAEGHRLQSVLDHLTTRIDDAMHVLGLRPGPESYVCALPTGSVNAQAKVIGRDVLIFINTGLLMLLHQVTKIMPFALGFQDVRDGESIESPQAGRPIYTLDEIQLALAEIVYAYLQFDDSTVATRFPAQGGFRGDIANIFRDSAELFTIAHEFGHILGGHLERDRRKFLVVSQVDQAIEVAAKTIEEEFEADRIAGEILLQYATRDNIPGVTLVKIAGPQIFFAIDALVTKVHKDAFAGTTSAVLDHPPSERRSELLQALFEDRIGSQNLEVADTASRWISENADVVVEIIRSGSMSLPR